MLTDPARSPFALFERFPRLAAAVPRLPLGAWPTSVTPLARFAEAHGLASLHAKREDRSHPECGGSKLRGVEFLLADARRRGATAIVTFGAAGSHHVRTTAWHARRLGMDTTGLVFAQPPAEYVRCNLLAGLATGTRFVPVNPATVGPRLLIAWLRARRGGRPCIIPPGGSSPLACLGHVNAAFELKRQIDAGDAPDPDVIFVPLGSLGTAAGLAVGIRLAGLAARLVGVVTYHRWYCTPGRWAALARRTHRLMRRLDETVPDIRIDKAGLAVVPTALGAGYGHFTGESVGLARELHATEGLELDGTYTAKTLAGAMGYIERHGLREAGLLYWHTYQPPPVARPQPESVPRDLRRYFRTSQPLDLQPPETLSRPGRRGETHGPT
ncbi:MAG: 1-aminocyclopropane-1-carboxylate deaminase/D-cysteine desulfhydrase [Phycisphaerae bacterium]